jgi:hypothetical protein
LLICPTGESPDRGHATKGRDRSWIPGLLQVQRQDGLFHYVVLGQDRAMVTEVGIGGKQNA